LNFALEYSIGGVQENQDRPEFNATHQVLVYADYVNLLAENISTIKWHIEKFSPQRTSWGDVWKSADVNTWT